MSNLLRLCGQRGLFRGEFVVTNNQCSFSIGDYIEVLLKDQPFNTGKTARCRRVDDTIRELPIIAFPLRVIECYHVDEIDVVLHSVASTRTFRHWMDCLDVGKISVVMPFQYQHRELIWYMPKIDGWVPGMYGRVRAPSPKSRSI